MKRLRVLSYLFLFLMAAGCGESGTRSSWSPCSNMLDGKKFDFECTTLQVPLNWDQPDGETIDLFVRQRLGIADTSQVSRPQLWLLQGGPGESGLPYAPLAKAIADSLPIDVYIPDHRGTGNSTRLSCPTYERDSSDGGYDVTRSEIGGCLQAAKQKWGENLADFSTTAAARDVGYAIEQLNKLAEIPQDVFVYGSSYGTYWANRYFQIFPEQAVGGILDSVVSPTLTFTTVAQDFEKVGVDLLTTYCANDTACKTRLSDDPMQFVFNLFQLIENGYCSALTTELNLASQADLETEIKGILSLLLEDWYLRVFIPPFLYRLNRCNTSDVGALVTLDSFLSKAVSGPDTQFAVLLYWNIAYSELWGSSPPSVDELKAQEQNAHFHPGFASYWRPMYDTWPRYPHDSYYGLWADTTIPFLILQGGLDPQTPFDQASKAKDQFNGAYQHFVSFPTSPHGIVPQSPMAIIGSSTLDFSNQCGFKVLLSFLGNRFSEPDLACINDMQPIVFADSLQISDVLFGKDDYWGDQSTLKTPLRASPDSEKPALPPIHPSPFPRWK